MTVSGYLIYFNVSVYFHKYEVVAEYQTESFRVSSIERVPHQFAGIYLHQSFYLKVQLELAVRMGEPGQQTIYHCCFSQERKASASDPIQFHSGHEKDVSPLSPMPCTPTIGNTGFDYCSNKRSSELKEAEKQRKNPPKASKRTRKISLFSQFHFNSRSEDKLSKSRKISCPTISSLIHGPAGLPVGYIEDAIAPDLSSDSSNSSVQSQQSASKLSIDSSPFLSKKTFSGTNCNNVTDKEISFIRDIILETLSLQFENVTEYKREVCDKLGKNVSELVRRRIEIVKEAACQPCKVVSLVYVGAVRDNGIDVATQALLDMDKDIFTAACYRNGHVFAMCAIIVVALDPRYG